MIIRPLVKNLNRALLDETVVFRVTHYSLSVKEPYGIWIANDMWNCHLYYMPDSWDETKKVYFNIFEKIYLYHAIKSRIPKPVRKEKFTITEEMLGIAEVKP